MKHSHVSAGANPPGEGPSEPPGGEPCCGEGTAAGSLDRLIVGIGCGAGGLEPLAQLIAQLPAGAGMSVLVLQNTDPSAQSEQMAQILQGAAKLKVCNALDGSAVEPDCIYIIPRDRHLSFSGGKLSLRAVGHCEKLRMPVDHLLCTIADQQGFRCCGVILSGKGCDGTFGMSEVKAAGGRTIVQAPATAQVSEMPHSAVSAGVVDESLDAGGMGEAIIRYAQQVAAGQLPRDDEAAMRGILAVLKTRTGHDFRCYKRNTLLRRIHRRAQVGRNGDFSSYLQFLHDHPTEAAQLRKDLLIGVTEFFRQPEAWRLLEEKVIPALIEQADEAHPIRAWVPACATGKEAYTLAMLLVEAVEASGKKVAIQVFATDTDEDALEVARTGAYSESGVKNVSPGRLKRFFRHASGRYQVTKKLRGLVVFAPQNLTSDPPFSKMDLVSCRNLLIYLDQQVQRKTIALFGFALRDGGCLFLGNAETAASQEHLFEPVSKRWRVYRRVGSPARIGLELPLHAAQVPGRLTIADASRRGSLAYLAQQALLEKFAPAAAITDRRQQLLYNHGPIEHYLTVAPGEGSLNIADMARDGLGARLRGGISRVIQTNRPLVATARVKRGGKYISVRITISPLALTKESEGLLLVTFQDVGPARSPSARHVSADSGLRQLEDELKVTREELQSTIEQLEASNEELKASNEEVMAANEELQSANEEMETSKEELQSLNDELNTLNTRLQEKVDELETANNDLVNFHASSNIPTLFLDRELKVRRFTPAVTSLLSLIGTDIGRPITDISRKSDDDTLVEDARVVLEKLAASQKEVMSADGRWFIRRILPYRTQDDRIEGVVVTFSDVTELKEAQQQAQRSANQARSLARFPEENPNPVMRIAADGELLYANPAAMACRDWQLAVGKPLAQPCIANLVQRASTQGQVSDEVLCGKHMVWLVAAPVANEAYVNVYGRDITERKSAQQSLERSEERLRRAQEIAKLGSWDLDLVANTLTWSDEVYRIFGLAPQEFAATYEAFLERIHPEDRQAVDAAYLGSLRDGRDSYEIEHRIVRKDTGDIRFVHEKCEHHRDISGRIIRSIGMVHDITERKQAETQIASDKRRYELLSQTAAKLLAAEDPQSMVEQLCREVMEFLACHVFFNFLVDDVAGRLHLNACAGIPPQEASRIEWLDYGAAVCGCAARDGCRVVAEHIPTTPDPRTELVKSYGVKAYACHPLMGVGGKVLGTLSFGTRSRETFSEDDLSLMKAIADMVATAMTRQSGERALQEAATELKRSNEDLAQFAYVASHDLQEPLRMVSGFMQLIKERYRGKLDDKADVFIDHAVEGAQRMHQLISDLLNYSRVDRKGRVDPVPARHALDVAMANLRTGIEQSGAVVTADELPVVLADSTQLAQVLQNLIGNAIKFRRPDTRPEIHISACTDDGRCVFQVRDNGIGIPDNQFERIFVIFQRLHTRDVHPGTGIGLALVKKIIERHGGKVWVESKVGQGTTFYFTLPTA